MYNVSYSRSFRAWSCWNNISGDAMTMSSGGDIDHGAVVGTNRQHQRRRRRLNMSPPEQEEQATQQQSEPKKLVRIRFPQEEEHEGSDKIDNKNVLLLTRIEDDLSTSSSSSSSSSSTIISSLPQQSLLKQQQLQTQQQSLPPQSLSLFSSISESPVPTYDSFLVFWLLLWVCYLLLPKGFRVTYCKAYPKRYARSSGKGNRFVFGMMNTSMTSKVGSTNSSYLGSSIEPGSLNSSGFFSSMPATTKSTSTESFSELAAAKHKGGGISTTNKANNTYSLKNPNMFSKASIDRQQRRREELYQTLVNAKREGQQIQQQKSSSTDMDSGIGDARSIIIGDDSTSMNDSYGYSGIGANRSVITATTATGGDGSGGNGGGGTLMSGIGDNRSIDLHEVLEDDQHPWSNDGKAPKTPTQTQRKSSPTTTPQPPSPKHPALSRIPAEDILSETMVRFKGRGIRLMAHGVQCRPKRVWVRLDLDRKAVTWQTEAPRRIQTTPSRKGDNKNDSSNTDVSIIMVRGSIHSIPLRNVLYIDVGKKTTALIKDPTVEGALCFSLLTANGSLDLQSNSKLERDALVSCLSFVLDEMNGGRDWRALYEPSLIMSDTNMSMPTTTAGSATKNNSNKSGSGGLLQFANGSTEF